MLTSVEVNDVSHAQTSLVFLAAEKAYRGASEGKLAQYRRFMRQRDQVQHRLDRLEQKQQAFVEEGRAPEYAAWAMAIEDSHEQAEADRRRSVLTEAQVLSGGEKGGPHRPSLSDLITAFLGEQERRHAISQSNPEALPRKRRLSHAALRSIKSQLHPFQAWVEDTGAELGGDSRATEAMLRRYRAHCDDLMVQGTIKAATVSNRVRGLRRLVDWLWQQRHIDELPRGLPEICAKYSQEKQAVALTDQEVKRLWTHANPRMRTLIALSLNCGFYFSEIAQLRGKDLQDGYAARRRPKTGVPSKHKLWKLTEQLVQRTRDNRSDEDLLYQTRNGYPLIHDNGVRCDSLYTPWRELCKRAKVKATSSQLRDTAATFIEGVGVRTGNPKLVSQFLAHADARTARWYIDQRLDPHSLETDALDAAIKEGEKHYAKVLKRA